MTKVGTVGVAGTAVATVGDVVVGTIIGSVLGAGTVTIVSSVRGVGSKSASYVE